VEEYTKEESSHEAGYDSFMTGCAFIGMLNYLYDVQQTPFVFANAQTENKVLYSKFAGEISLVGPVYSEKTAYNSDRIVIVGLAKKEHDW
jgi:tetrahydromethanopterin S-methyltransferase subunit H